MPSIREALRAISRCGASSGDACGVASAGLDSGKDDVVSVSLSSFSHSPSRAATAALRPASDFLISRMFRSGDDGAAAGEGREAMRGGGGDGDLLTTVDGDGGSGGSGTDGGGPGGTMEPAHGLVESVAAGFGGCFDGGTFTTFTTGCI